MADAFETKVLRRMGEFI